MGLARALLADDNLHLRSWGRRVLEEAGFAVEEAADGPSLDRALAERGPFVVAVVDVRMPPPTGLRVVALARGRGDRTPVVFITGFVDDELEATARQLGPAVVLAKPFDAHDLLGAARSVMDAGTGRPTRRPTKEQRT